MRRSLLVGLAAACCCAAVGAEEKTQRLAAEIVIMAGDTRRLLHEQSGPLERKGLEERLAGAAASLPLSLRRAGSDATIVAALRAAIARRDWRHLARQLDTLGQRHPFDARHLLDAAPEPRTLALGERLHKEVCAGCHDAPSNADALLPAKNLAAQFASMPPEEFAARLWLGVRGTRDNAYANPFADAELAALIAWYRQPR